MGSIRFFIALIFFELAASCGAAPKILLSPANIPVGCSSRVKNMKNLGMILLEAGYEVHLLIPEVCHSIQDNSGIKYLVHTSNEATKQMVAEKTEIGNQLLAATNHEMLEIVFRINENFCASLLQDKTMMSYLRNEDYSLVIYDQAQFCNDILMNIIDAPKLFYNNHGWIESLEQGIPTHLMYTRVSTSSGMGQVGFVARLENFFLYTMTLGMQYFKLYPLLQRLCEENDIPEISREDLFKTPNLLFTNTDFSFDYPRPLMPNMVTIGGIHSKEARRIPGKLGTFVEEAEDGLILVSFGTNSFKIPDESLKEYLAVFGARKERVLFKYAFDLPQKAPANVMVTGWVPQNDVLGHNKTRLFITHCGMSAVHETVFHKVPVIAIPTMGDQFHNAALLVDNARMGLKLDFWEITGANLASTIEQVLSNPEYRQRATHVSRRYREQPTRPVEKFLFWVNNVIAYGEPEHLIPEALKGASIIGILGLDVIAVVVAFIFLLAFVNIQFVKLLLSNIGGVHDRKSDTNALT